MSLREAQERLQTMRESMFAIGAGGLRELESGQIYMQPDTVYFMGASSSPQMIVVTKVAKDRLTYRTYPYKKELVIDRRIGEDLIVQGTKTWLSRGARFQPKLAKSLERMLDGKPGDKVDVEDFQPVRVEAVPTDSKAITIDKNGDKSISDKAWREAEEYGGVGFNFKDGVLDINMSRGKAKEMKKDKRFKILKIMDESVDEKYLELRSQVRAISEAGPVGQPQILIMKALEGTKGPIMFTELIAQSQFRGIHFSKLQKAAETLAKRDLVSFDGVSISLS